MAKTTEIERRSNLAEACIGFGKHLLDVRLSSVTPDEIQDQITQLFSWFSSHGALDEGNTGIAIRAIGFGEQLLSSRKTATVDEAVEAIQDLFQELSV